MSIRFVRLEQRVICWFSCGASSAYAAKLAVGKYPDAIIAYCDTSINEHPDNMRFLYDVEQWIGKQIKRIQSQKYIDIYDVFDRTGWLVGPKGARCTVELKKVPRQEFAQPNDIHILGMTEDESGRITRFEQDNPELRCEWILRDLGITKHDCIEALHKAGIELPAMYRLGYEHNNCIGCVKGGAGYWRMIRRDFPSQFERMAKQERKMNVRILKDYWLDELPRDVGRIRNDLHIECGLFC